LAGGAGQSQDSKKKSLLRLFLGVALVFKSSFIYFLAFALPGLLGACSFSVYTHELTPAEYAVYSVGASVSFLIGNVVFGWIRFSIGRFQAENPETNYVPLAILFYFIIALTLIPLALIGMLKADAFSLFAVLSCLAMTLSQALFDIVQEMRRARHQSGQFSRASVLRSVASFVLSVAVAAYFHSGAAVLFVTAISFLCFGILTYLDPRNFRSRESFDRAFIWRFLKYGMPLALSGFVFSGNSTFARSIVGWELGATPAGQFGAALDVTGQVIGILAGSVCSAIAPTAIAAFRNFGVAGARRQLLTGVEFFLGALVPTVAGLIITAHPFANFVSGHAFEAAVGDLLPMLAISRGLNVFAQYYLHLGFQIAERPLRQVVCGGVTLAVNIILSTVLTNSYGLAGASWALVISDFAGVAISIVLLRPVFPMPLPLPKLMTILACTLVMAVGCVAVRSVLPSRAVEQLFLTAFAGVAIYAVCAYVADVADVRSQSRSLRQTLLLRFRR